MKRKSLSLLAAVALVGVVYGPSPMPAQTISLGSAAAFSVLGATPNVTSTGPTVVTGDLGVWPAASAPGFPPGIVNGEVHLGDTVAQLAQTDLTAAYLDAAARPCPAANNYTGLVLGSGGTVLTVVPGVYCFSSTAQLTGNLFLNGPGVYIFQVGSGLTTATDSSITPTNGASACNVWWQIGSSASLGTRTTFLGNILALTSITVDTNARVNGRLLARNGTVTLQSNSVGGCATVAPPGPTPPCECTGSSRPSG